MKPFMTLLALILVLSPPLFSADDHNHDGCENCTCGQKSEDSKSNASDEQGKFNFSLKDLDGKLHDSAKMKDKIIVLLLAVFYDRVVDRLHGCNLHFCQPHPTWNFLMQNLQNGR